VLFVLQFQGASAAANLQLRAFFAFFLGVFSFAKFLRQWVVPNLCPWLREDVSEAFKVALARVNVAVGSHTSVYHGGGAAFNA
jgi:hypothetical protein